MTETGTGEHPINARRVERDRERESPLQNLPLQEVEQRQALHAHHRLLRGLHRSKLKAEIDRRLDEIEILDRGPDARQLQLKIVIDPRLGIDSAKDDAAGLAISSMAPSAV